MRYLNQHIFYILDHYKGEMPLANYLKFYFKKYPILGSRDRKLVSEIVYCFYRCAKGFDANKINRTAIIDASLLLAESNLPHIASLLPESWKDLYGKGFRENEAALKQEGIGFDIDQLFVNNIVFSEGIDKQKWLQSVLRRPRLFIRLVVRYLAASKRLLQEANIDFESINEYCLAFANGTSIEKILPANAYRIQDASSQKMGDYFTIKDKETLWDCCSGAGGKSLLVKDIAPNAVLCVSDIRKSILDNLAARFAQYGFAPPERLLLSVADEAQTRKILDKRTFQHIIADVPCSGSGTWARSPEQLYFYDEKTLSSFAQRQKAIVQNAVGYLAVGGTFVYITCSVFAAENEEIVAYILAQNNNLKIIKQELVNGIGIGADSMFVAVFCKG